MQGVGSGLEDRIRELEVAPGTVACVWLGQAGYLLKSPAGVVVMMDPYLSDWAEYTWGMRRVVPPAIDPARLVPDLLLVSHWHEDHLDAPTVKLWARDAQGIIAGPISVTVRAQAWGWSEERTALLNRGMSYQLRDVSVTATFARHDEDTALTPDAVGFLLDIGGVRIWNVADTEYDARLRAMSNERIDVVFVPINGVGGNMNVYEAALLMWHVRPRVAIPMHYDMWAPEDFGPGATLDPRVFAEWCEKLDAGCKVRELQVGEIVTLTAGGA
ncbi:MAG TPA: MBL fold metallo-hydrolase [Thermomicrobiales bacterium]